MKNPEAVVRVPLIPANPGQFFACCGLLELADRLWSGAEGWFERESEFCIWSLGVQAETATAAIEQALRTSVLSNTMTGEELARLKWLSEAGKKNLTAADEADKKRLEGIRREAPLQLGSPIGIRLDWWRDDRSGGSRFKTWAGQQSVIEIAKAMKAPIESGDFRNLTIEEWFAKTISEGVPFNFDADLGPQSTSIDVGFSLDPLGIRGQLHPVIEFLTLIGLQRFRPRQIGKQNLYQFALWSQSLPPAGAAVAAAAISPSATTSVYEFSLLYRTKYLKSFLPAQLSKGTP